MTKQMEAKLEAIEVEINECRPWAKLVSEARRNGSKVAQGASDRVDRFVELIRMRDYLESL